MLSWTWREYCYYSGKLQRLWVIECILLWCSLTKERHHKHHSKQSQLGHSMIRSSVNECFITDRSWYSYRGTEKKGLYFSRSAHCIQCTDKMLLKWHLRFGGRYLHPEGLPSDYTVSVLFRILPDTPQEAFALWEILNKANEPLVGLILDSEYWIWQPAVCILVAKKLL